MSKIEINNVYKIFGNNPILFTNGRQATKRVLKTGYVDLDNVSLKMKKVKHFCMGYQDQVNQH